MQSPCTETIGVQRSVKRPLFVARQSRQPSGLAGRVIASIMARETARLNDRAVELLALAPSDVVLEVGFGHGRTIELLAAVLDRGHVVGVDVSEAMQRLATSRNRAAVLGGRVELHTGDCASLPFVAGHFDRAVSVHTLYFWDDPLKCLREIARVLRRGGRFVLGFTPSDSPHASSFPPEIYTFYGDEEVVAMLAAAGFEGIELVQSDGAVLAVACRSA
jgi:ubiquinone/menaquinone biosynthesis C-methylase UbiE